VRGVDGGHSIGIRYMGNDLTNMTQSEISKTLLESKDNMSNNIKINAEYIYFETETYNSANVAQALKETNLQAIASLTSAHCQTFCADPSKYKIFRIALITTVESYFKVGARPTGVILMDAICSDVAQLILDAVPSYYAKEMKIVNAPDCFKNSGISVTTTIVTGTGHSLSISMANLVIAVAVSLVLGAFIL
jgi:hypothetical protein